MPTLPMKTRHTATMVQPNSTFNDFNPLDVLATAASLQSARLGDGNSERTGGSNGCDGSGNTEESSTDDADSNTRRVIIKTVQSDNVKTDVIKLNGNNNAQTGNPVVKKTNGDIFGVPVSVNGKHSGVNGDVKKNSIAKILEGSNTKVLTAQEGKSLLSLGKTTSAKVLMQEGKSVLAFPDGTRLVMPGKPVSKGVTVLKINKQQVNDHSYTFVCQLKNLRQDEDEGYNSRSSMDSEGEEHPAQSPSGSDSVLGSPKQQDTPDGTSHINTDLPSPIGSQGPLSPKGVTSPTSSKPAKIVIVKRDPNVKQQEMTPKQVEDSKLMPSPGTNNGTNKSVVLRTLLKQKPILGVLAQKEAKTSASNSSLLSMASPKVGDVSEAQQVSDSSTSETVAQIDSSSSKVIKSILTASEEASTVETPSSNTDASPCDSIQSETTNNSSTNSEITGTVDKSDVHSLGEDSGTVDEQSTEALDQCSNPDKISEEQRTTDSADTPNDSLEHSTSLDNEVTQITSEMVESSGETSSTDPAQSHQYIIQDDLPPSEKQEQEASVLNTENELVNDQDNKSDKDTVMEGQGETVHITNTEETDCVSVGSPEAVVPDVSTPLVENVQPTPAPSTVQLLVTSSPPKSANFSNLTGLLKANQQSRLTTKMLQQSAGNGVVHVIPVSAVKGLSPSAQVIPRTVQYLATLPGTTLNSRTQGLVRVQPAGGNKLVQPTTIIVPATGVMGSGLQSRLLPVIGSSLTKPVDGIQSIKFSTDTHGLAPRPASVTGGILTGIKTPPMTGKRSLTPVSAFSAGPSSGRTTPVNAFIKSSLHSTSEQCMSPSEKINLKISSSSIVESPSSEMEASPMSAKETATTSIGTLGSLSMKTIEGLDDIGKAEKANGLSKGEFIRIQGSSLRISSTGTEERSETPCSSLGSPESDISNIKSPNVSRPTTPGLDPIEGSSRTGQTYRRVRQRKVRLGEGGPEPSVSTGYLSATTELHPVVDHDYCKFTEFSGDIQRSIIATSECKARIERKYSKKARAARVAKDVASSALIAERAGRPRKQERIPKVLREKQERTKKGRYKKKDKETACLPSPRAKGVEDNVFDDDADLMVPTSDEESNISLQDSSEERKLKKKVKKEKPERKLRWRSDKSKNYVKITGSYQDEFVYFTSKNHRKAPRKFEGPLPDSSIIMGKSQKLPPVGGTVNVFDWYRDMAKTDKTQFGGISGNVAPNGESSPNQSLQNSYTDLSTGYNTSVPTSALAIGPKSEAEVVDLVCELSGLGNSETVETASLGTSELDMNTFLNSIGEDELKMLESSVKTLGDSATHAENTESKPDVTPLHETSFDGFLANFSQENGPSLSQESNPICDLDEINDSDLLQSDIGNMNAFLGAENNNTGAQQSHIVVSAADETNLTAVPPSVANPLFRPMPEIIPTRLDKNELFADMSQPDALSSDVTAPELTVVSMYWNDLPGLLINGEQYVRLVDIHKQVLPAKDTGILKKRCQMMGLPIHNCSELQRDFLMRYANAAKSKSTVIVSKESAKTLIGFYVDPRPRTRGDSHCSKEDVSSPTRKDIQDSYVKREPNLSLGTVNPAVGDVAVVATPNPPAGDGDTKALSGGKGRPRKRKLLASPPRTPSSPRRTVTPRIHLSSLSTEVKRSARLQHKRVRYDEMVMGNHSFSEESGVDSPQLTPLKPGPLRVDPNINIKQVKRQVLQARRHLPIPTVLQEDDNESNVSSDHENKDITNVLRPVFPEEHEIKRLRLKARRFRLSTKEKRRLRRLRERVRRLHLEHRKHLKEKSIIAAEKQKNALMKSKKKLMETHLYTKKYNQEHCYAACPENFDKTKKEESQCGESSSMQEMVIRPDEIKVEEVVLVADAAGNANFIPMHSQESSKSPEDVNGNEISGMKQEDVVVGEIVVSELRSGDDMVKAVEAQQDNGEKTEVKPEEKVFLEIVHRDATRSGRGKWQDGIMHMHLYKEKDANCITCVMCNELLSVKRFMKHMHPHNRVDELLDITLPQRLELRRPDNATDLEKELWSKFQALQEEYNKAEKQVRTRNRKSLESTVKEEQQEEEETPKLKKTPKADPQQKAESVEKKAKVSPRSQSSTPVRNGHISGGRTRIREKSETTNNSSKGSPMKLIRSSPTVLLNKLTPPALAKLEMPPVVSPSESSPQDNSVRQSGRVRKRKQLHPCESYVFSSGRNLTAEGVPESKRVKVENTQN